MSATNNEYKTLVDEALHNHFHGTPETEMILKDWLYGVCSKAEALDRISDKLEEYDCEAHDSLNVNYHDFGADTSHIVDKISGGFWDE